MFLSFKNLKALSKEATVELLDNFNKILFFSLISHLLDGKKYKLSISSNENLD